MILSFQRFNDPSHVPLFHEYLNSKHGNINFTYETEIKNTISFLDVNVKRDSMFHTSVFRKSTFSGLGTSFFSHCPLRFRLSSIQTLITRAYRLCSNYESLHCEFNFLRNFFSANGYPKTYVDRFIRKFLDSRYQPDVSQSDTVSKKVYISLPFFGPQSEKLKTELQKLLSRHFTEFNFQIILKNTLKIGSLFHFKDSLDKSMRSSLVYQFSCERGRSPALYVGSTIRHLYERVAEHAGVSARTSKPVSCPTFSSIREHSNTCNCKISLDSFKVLGSAQNELTLRILESLYIHRKRPNLNNQVSSSPLLIIE